MTECVGTPGVATGQPATGQPATGQPATGMPATGQPAQTAATGSWNPTCCCVVSGQTTVENQCMTRIAAALTPGAGAGGGTCGNGVLEMGEECDGTVPATMTCQGMLGPMATGMITCVSCMLNTTQCMAGPNVTGGTGGSM